MGGVYHKGGQGLKDLIPDVHVCIFHMGLARTKKDGAIYFFFCIVLPREVLEFPRKSFKKLNDISLWWRELPTAKTAVGTG